MDTINKNDKREPPWIRYVAYEINGSVIAFSTVSLSAPICQFFILRRNGDELKTKVITYMDRDMLIAFDCAEDITPKTENTTINIIHLQNHGGKPVISKFVVER